MDNEPFTLTPDNMPGAPGDMMEWGGLVLDTSYGRSVGWVGADHDDPPFEVVDHTHGFDCFAMPEGYRRFGLWLIHLLFSGRDWAGLSLIHPVTRARALYVKVARPLAGSGLRADPVR